MHAILWSQQILSSAKVDFSTFLNRTSMDCLMQGAYVEGSI